MGGSYYTDAQRLARDVQDALMACKPLQILPGGARAF